MSHSRLRLLGGIGALALTAVPAAQAPAPQNARDVARPTIGTAVIAGTLITDDDTHRPIQHALVTLGGSDFRDQRSTATDDRGQFLFPELPGGHYSINASKPGYCPSYYGAKVSWRGPSSPVTLEDGQRATVAMKMLHGAVIAGTIFDTFGRPQPGVRVAVSMYRTVGGVKRLEPFFGNVGSTMTDDLGAYRAYGLAPGEYAVIATVPTPTNAETRLVTNDEIQWAQRQLQRPGQATAGVAGVNPPRPGPATGYAPIYFPGTADAGGATTVTLAASEERDGVDFPLQWVATARISGTITDVEGRPAPSVSVNLVAKQMIAGLAPFSGRGQSDGRGSFSFPGVTPGEYTVLVRLTGRNDGPGGRAGGPPPPRPILWAEQEIAVRGDDVTGLSLHLQPALSVSGRMVFQGATPPPPDLSKVRVGLGPAPSAGTTTTTITMGGAPPEINPDGTFTVTGATPGRYRLSAFLPSPPATGPAGSAATPAWLAESVVSGGVETLDTALEISTSDISGVVVTFTDHPTELSGHLLDSKGKPTPEYWVVTFTTDRAFWTPGSRRVRTMRPDADGKFRMVGLPPGEYYMVALTDLDQVDMSDAAFLEQLAAASIKITLADGEKKAQDLKLSGGSPD